jgi:hypothetical protein
MGRSDFVLIDSGAPLAPSAEQLARVLRAGHFEPLLDGQLINLGDLGDKVRGDVEEGFSSLGYPLMLALSDVAPELRPDGVLDAAAARVYDQIAGALPWRIALCIEDEGGELVVSRERAALSATA